MTNLSKMLATMLLGCVALLSGTGWAETTIQAAEAAAETPAVNAEKPTTKKRAPRAKPKSKLQASAGSKFQNSTPRRPLSPQISGGSTAVSGSHTPVTGMSANPSVVSATGDRDTSGADFNRRIVEFAASRIGTQVGDGECTALADEALKSAGARPALGYDFGRAIPLKDALPGDIVQFESAGFQGPGYWTILGVPHHTAVVSAVKGTRMTILHQNFNENRTVQAGVLDLSHLKIGQVIVYRAMSK